MATRRPAGARDDGAVRRYGLSHVIGAVLVITVAIAAVAFELIRDRKANIATARAWDIQGPPCPELTEAAWTVRRLKAPKTFDYDGATIGRWSGNASCSDVKAGGGTGLRTDRICQFTNPLVLSVATPAGRFFYDVGMAQPATLSIHRDRPKCVLASKFTRRDE